MAERYEMDPLPAETLASLPPTAEWEGKPIATADVEAKVPADLRADVSVLEDGRRRFPWRGRAVQVIDSETGKVIDWIT